MLMYNSLVTVSKAHAPMLYTDISLCALIVQCACMQDNNVKVLFLGVIKF